MTTPRWIALLATTLLTLSACGKPKPTTQPPTTVISRVTDEGGADDTVEDPGPPQEPDPAELAQARHEVLLGHYQEAIDVLTPLYADLKEREQYRAGGLAAGWLAVAHAQIVFENGAEPAEHAAAMADRTGDPEVDAAAKLARGAILLAHEDFPAAAEALAAAIAASPKTIEGAVAMVWDGESLIGSAFGGGSTIIKPEDLDAAKAAYGKAVEAAGELGDEKDVLLGRAHEGLAAIADYQKDKSAICTHAFASIDAYKAAGSSEMLVAGPSELASKNHCKP